MFKQPTEVEEKEIVALIEKLTGAKAFALVISDTPIPCESEVQKKHCEGHQSFVYLHNIKSNYVDAFLEDVLDQALQEEGVPSPFLGK